MAGFSRIWPDFLEAKQKAESRKQKSETEHGLRVDGLMG
jgi:hypothetical protein